MSIQNFILNDLPKELIFTFFDTSKDVVKIVSELNRRWFSIVIEHANSNLNKSILVFRELYLKKIGEKIDIISPRKDIRLHLIKNELPIIIKYFSENVFINIDPEEIIEINKKIKEKDCVKDLILIEYFFFKRIHEIKSIKDAHEKSKEARDYVISLISNKCIDKSARALKYLDYTKNKYYLIDILNAIYKTKYKPDVISNLFIEHFSEINISNDIIFESIMNHLLATSEFEIATKFLLDDRNQTNRPEGVTRYLKELLDTYIEIGRPVEQVKALAQHLPEPKREPFLAKLESKVIQCNVSDLLNQNQIAEAYALAQTIPHPAVRARCLALEEFDNI
jgi:hypothetical protein